MHVRRAREFAPATGGFRTGPSKALSGSTSPHASLANMTKRNSRTDGEASLAMRLVELRSGHERRSSKPSFVTGRLWPISDKRRQRGQTLHDLQRRHHDVDDAVAPRRLRHLFAASRRAAVAQERLLRHRVRRHCHVGDSGGDRCSMDDLEKPSDVKDACLARIVAVPNEVTRFEKARPWPRRGGTRSPRRAGGARHPSLQFAEPSNNSDAATLAA